MSAVRFQPPGEPVLIGNWKLSEDYPVHPQGAKPKKVVICPSEEEADYLIGGHHYLFKRAKDWQAMQIWSEVIAYRIAALAGMDVPPCFVAVNERSGETGALVEFFYRYPNEPISARFAHAAEFLGLADRKRGRPHNLNRNLRLSEKLSLPDAINWWARTLAFDALIGNTDRHPENWGVLFRETEPPPGFPERWQSLGLRVLFQPDHYFAPVYDNATSLGYEYPEDRLARLLDAAQLKRYIRRGTHHCGWVRDDDGPMPHFELCRRFVSEYPQAVEVMRSVLNFEMTDVESLLAACAEFDVPLRFTPARAEFVAALVDARRTALLEVLDE